MPVERNAVAHNHHITVSTRVNMYSQQNLFDAAKGTALRANSRLYHLRLGLYGHSMLRGEKQLYHHRDDTGSNGILPVNGPDHQRAMFKPNGSR
jgi:hypothetical protein